MTPPREQAHTDKAYILRYPSFSAQSVAHGRPEYLLDDVAATLEEGAPGSIEIEVVAMSQERLDALPDFDGW